MNVLYDVSLLGFCGDDPSKITGMPRAILELAARLRHQPDCDVTFCAFDAPALSYEFLRRHSAFDGARLAPEPAREGEIDAQAARQAQLLHSTHNPLPAAARAFPHLACVQTVYDMIPFLFPDTLPQRYVEFYGRVVSRLRPTDTVITISQSAKADFCDIARFDPARVHVTSLAANAQQFRPCADLAARAHVRARYGVPEAPYLLSVCTFEPRKNVRHVVRCFARLLQEQPSCDLHLVLAGGVGWKFEPILAEIEAAQSGPSRLRERIVVTGYVAEEDLAPLYSGALAFLYLSLYEGFGLPPLEAMQCGVPVVCSNLSSLPEVVGDAGILLDPNDSDGLCAAMLELARSEPKRAELSARALQRAREFSWERCARETVAAYHAALQNR